MNYIKFAIVEPIRYFYHGITTFSSFFNTDSYTREGNLPESKSKALARDWQSVAGLFNKSVEKTKAFREGKI